MVARTREPGLPGHVERQLRRAVQAMHDNLGERLTLDDLARAAMFSKFHFSRMFLRATGLSPGRFLSALRLQEAKRLLLATDWNVIDVGMRVGYQSVGTFSTRFARSVGMSPSEYRVRRGHAQRLPAGTLRWVPEQHRLQGRIATSPGEPVRPVVVGVFPGRIAQGRPISATVVQGTGRYELATAANQECYLLAFTVPSRRESPNVDGRPGWRSCRRVGPLRPGEVTQVDLWMSPEDPLDAPVLLALPHAEALAPRSPDPLARVPFGPVAA